MKRLVLLLLLLIAIPVSGQDVTPTAPPAEINSPVRAEFEVDNDTPLPGEPFNITLSIQAPAEVEILTWVEFEYPIQVIEEGDVVSEQEDFLLRRSRTYTVVLWETGEYLSEGALVTYQSGGTVSSVPVSSFYVQVPSQIVNPEDAVLRPSVPPIDLFYLSPWWFAGAGVILLVVAMIFTRLIQLSRRGVVQIISASPAEKAIAELEDLKIQQLPAATIYELVANYLRQYLQSQFEIDAVEMTTVELMGILRQQNIFPKNHRRQLQGVLEQSDLVKFARFQPDKTSSTRLVNYAIKWLKETERLQQDV